MVVTSELIKLIRSIPHLRDNVVLETRTAKHTLAKEKWLKEFFGQYIDEIDESLLTNSLSKIVIDCVNWERIIKVFENEKTSDE